MLLMAHRFSTLLAGQAETQYYCLSLVALSFALIEI
jgi:hypothetical protein